MAFQDAPIHPGLLGFIMSGLGVSKTAAMTLEVATGSAEDYRIGETYTLSSSQNHVFTSDATYAKYAQISLVDNGSITDIWVDEYKLDGDEGPADPPSGYKVIQSLAWFEIAAGETNLDNSTIFRRTWV
jgi:hypothetical protein